VDIVEKDFKVSNVLRENIDSLGGLDKCRIFKMEAVRFSKAPSHGKYDLILADPPFFKNDIHSVVANLLQNDFLEEDGLIIVERSVQTRKEDEENFGKEAFKKIGDSLIYSFDRNDFPNKN
jgi:16S rRNA G966 N2-methylase RsmD